MALSDQGGRKKREAAERAAAERARAEEAKKLAEAQALALAREKAAKEEADAAMAAATDEASRARAEAMAAAAAAEKAKMEEMERDAQRQFELEQVRERREERGERLTTAAVLWCSAACCLLPRASCLVPPLLRSSLINRVDPPRPTCHRLWPATLSLSLLRPTPQAIANADREAKRLAAENEKLLQAKTTLTSKVGNLESMLETADRKMRESLLLAEKAKREVGESKAQAKQARAGGGDGGPHTRTHARTPHTGRKARTRARQCPPDFVQASRSPRRPLSRSLALSVARGADQVPGEGQEASERHLDGIDRRGAQG